MSTQTILLVAIAVFGLLATGIVLTIREFYRISHDPSVRKGVAVDEAATKEFQDTV